MAELTREKILAMTAGLEMDRLIDALVMGKRHTFLYRVTVRNNGEGIPSYSSDIAAAWEVVEEMRRRFFFSGEASAHRMAFGKRFLDELETAVNRRLGYGVNLIHRDNLLMLLEPQDIARAALLATLTEAA